MSTLTYEPVQSVERGTEIQVRPPESVTPMSLIERAVSANASIEQLQQLLELQIRWEQNEAKKAFDVAMARFKANSPTVSKNVSKKAGNIDLFYASLDNCVRVIVPALAQHGLRHHWTNDQSTPGQITVTCVVSHELGHSESNSFTANYDTSGGKNAIQAIASAITYAQRYTLLGATGLAATGTDNDGGGAGKGKLMEDEDLFARLDAIAGAVDNAQLQDFYLKSLKAAREIGDKAAEDQLSKAKNARYRELNGKVQR